MSQPLTQDIIEAAEYDLHKTPLPKVNVRGRPVDNDKLAEDLKNSNSEFEVEEESKEEQIEQQNNNNNHGSNHVGEVEQVVRNALMGASSR